MSSRATSPCADLDVPVAPPDAAPLPLRALRLTLGPHTTAASLGRFTVVRTPTRPDHLEGNALHLHSAPDGADVDGLEDEWRHRFGAVPGVERLRIRWVEPEPGRDLAALREVAAQRGLDVDVAPQWQLAHLPAEAPAVTGAEVVVPSDPRRWHGATVLYRHGVWAGDDDLWRWRAEGWRVLAARGQAMTHVVSRWGVPVATASLAWDPAAEVAEGHAGLAVICDVVVHPAHRASGLAPLVVHSLAARLLQAHARAQVVLIADPGSTGVEDGWMGFRLAGQLGGLCGRGPEGLPTNVRRS